MINKMKKGLKLWMLAVAFLATMTAVISTGKVEAEDNVNNEVTVEISSYNGGLNNCTWDNYFFSFSGTSSVQTGTTGGTIKCAFWSHSSWTVTLQLSWDLTNSDKITIPSSNVKIKNWTWTSAPETLGDGTSMSEFVNFGKTDAIVTLYNKNDNKIWDATWTNIEIQVVVPEWQPDGTYTWTLVLTF